MTTNATSVCQSFSQPQLALDTISQITVAAAATMIVAAVQGSCHHMCLVGVFQHTLSIMFDKLKLLLCFGIGWDQDMFTDQCDTPGTCLQHAAQHQRL